LDANWHIIGGMVKVTHARGCSDHTFKFWRGRQIVSPNERRPTKYFFRPYWGRRIPPPKFPLCGRTPNQVPRRHSQVNVPLSRFIQLITLAREFDARYQNFSQVGWLLTRWSFDDRAAHYRARLCKQFLAGPLTEFFSGVKR